MCRSGLCTSTPAGGAMSAAVTSPGPCLRRYMVTGSSESELTTRPLRFRMISVTSSLTPGTVVNSCRVPSIRMLVTAAPGIDDRRVRRRELPRVYPKPGSSGSITKPERDPEIVSSVRVGRCAMSMVVLLLVLRRPPYDAVRGWCRRGGHLSALPAFGPLPPPRACERLGQGVLLLLGVELHDQLLLDRGVDHLAGRDAVHEHAQLAADDLEPGRHGTLAGAGLGDLERQHRARLLGHLDDVVLAHPVGRDVDLAAVDPDVAVAHQLARHVAGLGEAGPVDHVVQPRLQDLEQDLTGLAGLAVGLFVVTAELLLEHAVDAAGLLLLTKLEQVLAVLGAATAVLARRVGPDLDRALRGLALAALEEQLHLLAPAHAAVGSGVTGHVKYSCFV